jgi:RTX calcium-binding nonapeptide repeat (4 copies)
VSEARGLFSFKPPSALRPHAALGHGAEVALGSPAKNDDLRGGNGNDTLRGGDNGNDNLNGGAGSDALFGQTGADSLNTQDGVSENDRPTAAAVRTAAYSTRATS